MALSLVVLVPTLGRPHRLEPLAEEFRRTTPEHRLLFILDPDDSESYSAALRAGEALVSPKPGYPAKVNLGVRMTTEDYILLAADDVKPHPGWFQIAVSQMSDTIGYVSLNDLGNKAVMRGRHATFPLIARWYAELDAEVYHEGYQHNFCDREATAKAQQRGAFAYAPRAIMEHLHPLWGKAQEDDVYREWALDPDKFQADQRLFEERRQASFP